MPPADHVFLSVHSYYHPGSPLMFHGLSSRWIGCIVLYCVYRDKHLCTTCSIKLASINIWLTTALEDINIEFVVDSVVLFFGRCSRSCNLTENVASQRPNCLDCCLQCSTSYGVLMYILALVVHGHGSGKAVKNTGIQIFYHALVSNMPHDIGSSIRQPSVSNCGNPRCVGAISSTVLYLEDLENVVRKVEDEQAAADTETWMTQWMKPSLEWTVFHGCSFDVVNVCSK